jgi:superfamily II DNA or RNA helicase
LRFEQLCAWLLESDPAFSISRTYSWSQWRERRLTRDDLDVGIDTGIDVVAETESGELWAVQAKCYGEGNRVTTDDINSFIARSATSEFSRLLLIASTDKLAAVGRQKLLQARNPDAAFIGLAELRGLERTDWPLVGAPVRAAAVRRLNKLRPHQLAAMRDVVEHGFRAPGSGGGSGAKDFASSGIDRGQLLMACGTGKTLVGQRIAEKLRSDRTLVVVPSLSLLEQTHRSWKADATRRFDAFCFCSDPTVARAEGADGDRDVDAIAVPVHTDPEQLAEFLADKGRRLVVFATYQSLARLTDVFADPQSAAPFDLVIADEAHRSAGRADSTFGLVCDDQRLPATRRLFMTATPRVVTGARDEDLVLSMDDEARYGPVFHHLKFSDAVAQDLLCDYQVLVIAADPGEHVRLVESRSFVSTLEHETATADALAVQLAVAQAMERNDLRRILSFHSRVKGAKAFARELPATVRWRGSPADQLWTQAVSGAMPAGQRRMLLRRLERLDDCDRGLLSNARCLGEGVDVPAVDAAVFVDPRESVIDVTQAVGRTMRKSQQTGKQRGTIVLPVVVDAESNADEVLESSAFATVWKVLRALRSHDDRLDDEMEALLQARTRSRSMGPGVPRVSFELPSISLDEGFAQAFSVMAVEVTSDSFERGLAELAAHIEAGGDARPSRHAVAATGFRLGIWCHGRRNEYKAGKLSREQVAALEALGFVWDPNQDTFDRGFGELTAYIEANGNGRVPSAYVTDTGFELGVWCGVRRTMRKSGQLSAERVALLDGLGFVWDQLQHEFERALAELAAYAVAHGNARVPQDYATHNGYRLGSWCSDQRKRYRRGKLSVERVQALEALGFDWEPNQAAYDRGLAELRGYVAEHGDARVPDGYKTTGGHGLAKWCGLRRREYKAGKLDEDQVAELEALGFVWDPLQDGFDRGLMELSAYVEVHGTAKVPGKHVTQTGFALGAWCGVRRQDLKAGRLSSERKASLDAFGFVWDPHGETFALGMAELVDYVAAHRNASVPRTYRSATGYQLGQWASRRRSEYREGRLTTEHIASLEALGFAWEPREEPWDIGVAQLSAYVETNGHAKVPATHRTESGFALGSWCGTRRQDRRAGRLSAARVDELDALGFVWAPHQELWDRGLAELSALVRETGSARMTDRYTTGTGFGLGAWCAARRRDLKAGRLNEERVAALADLGVTLDSVQGSFDRGLAELTSFVGEHGHARVPSAYRTPTGSNLGKWCSHQRDDRKQGRLSDEQVRALDELGFVWDTLQHAFDTGLAELAAYVEEQGNAGVPQGFVSTSGFKLGVWCSERRTDRRLGRLAPEREAALDELGFVWSKFAAAFNAGVAELAAYVAEYGDARVAQAYVASSGFKLGSWCSARRTDYKHGRLPRERIATLEALRFEWTTSTSEQVSSAGQ